ncbi:MAG: RNA polymerase factor sigma-32 [Magnetococcales bacterium]|nr:RNA polymerase factor sigma-32 [Magnetococcales bacterium]
MSINTLAIHRSSSLTVQDRDSRFQKFIKHAYEAPLLSEQEEFELSTRLQQKDDLDAAHKLVHSYLRYVVKIANEYRNYKLCMSDMVQEGTVGLMQAVKKFDPKRGSRLSTYAVWWIRAAIHEFILRSWRMVKIATTQLKRQLFFKLRQSKDSSAPLNMEEAEELAKKFDTNPEIILEVDSRMSGNDSSLNQPALDDDVEIINLIPDQRPNQEHEIAAKEQCEFMGKLIAKGLSRLNKREKDIISNRFLTEKPETLETLGEKFSLSRERIRQIEKSALDKLKHFLQNTPGGRDLLLES